MPFSILSTDLSQSSTVMASKPKSSVKNTLLLLNSSTVLFIARSNGISEISANINILAAYFFPAVCIFEALHKQEAENRKGHAPYRTHDPVDINKRLSTYPVIYHMKNNRCRNMVYKHGKNGYKLKRASTDTRLCDNFFQNPILLPYLR